MFKLHIEVDARGDQPTDEDQAYIAMSIAEALRRINVRVTNIKTNTSPLPHIPSCPPQPRAPLHEPVHPIRNINAAQIAPLPRLHDIKHGAKGDATDIYLAGSALIDLTRGI